MMSRMLALLALAALGPVAYSQPDEQEEKKQDAPAGDNDPKEAMKKMEAQAKERVRAFEKAWKKAKGEIQRAEALNELRESADGPAFAHDLVFQAIEKVIADSTSEVFDKAYELVKGVEHPGAARVLGAVVRKKFEDAAFMKEMVGLMTSYRYDAFLEAMGEFVSVRTFGANRDTVTTASARDAGAAIGAVAMVPGLLKTCKVMDENLKFGAKLGADTPESLAYRKNTYRALRECSAMPDLGEDAEAYIRHWEKNKDRCLAKAKVILWCPTVGKRWEKVYGDKNSVCPHHEGNSKAAKKCFTVIYTTVKPDK